MTLTHAEVAAAQAAAIERLDAKRTEYLDASSDWDAEYDIADTDARRYASELNAERYAEYAAQAAKAARRIREARAY